MEPRGKCVEPYGYDRIAEGFSCPECGKPQVTDEFNGFLWCINKACDAFSVLFDYNYKGE